MAKTYHTLPNIELKAGTSYVHTGDLPEIIHLEDFAINAMVDLTQMKALTIGPDSPIIHARMEMMVCGVHMLLVVDEQSEVIGLITSEDILGSKPIQMAQENHIERSDVKVRMVMTDYRKIFTIDRAELDVAKVGHIIETLRNAKTHYALVVNIDPENQQQTICGLFSLSSISRQLDMNVTDDDLLANSLADLQQWMK